MTFDQVLSFYIEQLSLLGLFLFVLTEIAFVSIIFYLISTNKEKK